MKIININTIDQLKLDGRRVVALGLFESMHRGHQKLICETVKIAHERNLVSSVVTVSNPVNKAGLPIFDLNHRLDFMDQLGIDEVIVIEMNDQVRNSSADDFIRLLQNMDSQIIISGSDHRFGYMGSGDVELLKANFKTLTLDFIEQDDMKVSTTEIKSSLAEGKIKHANLLLGYNYYIKGVVKKGKQLGRTIGVPTANIYPSISPLATGVYLTRTEVAGNHYRSITNIGYNPTTGDDRLSIETYIGDGFNTEIYDQTITVEMIEKMRNEVKFDSLDELVKQLNSDIKYMEETNYENCWFSSAV